MHDVATGKSRRQMNCILVSEFCLSSGPTFPSHVLAMLVIRAEMTADEGWRYDKIKQTKLFPTFLFFFSTFTPPFYIFCMIMVRVVVLTKEMDEHKDGIFDLVYTRKAGAAFGRVCFGIRHRAHQNSPSTFTSFNIIIIKPSNNRIAGGLRLLGAWRMMLLAESVRPGLTPI